ncbi:hypothetical protein BKA69DRAFT_1044411 [Paraphysoderma sedebokerense]|nr:hypothetical protein BKA69DRAFT_1044411 [Paraphysoderma sedebokerense]
MKLLQLFLLCLIIFNLFSSQNAAPITITDPSSSAISQHTVEKRLAAEAVSGIITGVVDIGSRIVKGIKNLIERRKQRKAAEKRQKELEEQQKLNPGVSPVNGEQSLPDTRAPNSSGQGVDKASEILSKVDGVVKGINQFLTGDGTEANKGGILGKISDIISVVNSLKAAKSP